MSLPSMEFNQKRWNRLLLSGYWVTIFLSVLVELLYMLHASELPRSEFFPKYIALPTSLMFAAVLTAEASVRLLSPKWHDYVLISTASLLALIVTSIHTTLDYLLFFLCFPNMISIFYFQYKKLAFAIAATFASLFFLYAVIPEIHRSMSFIDLLCITVLLAIYSGIALGVLARGRETLRHLRSSYESNQELLVRNIMMDKLAKTDALTDTYNHMAYHEFVEKLVEQAEKGLLHLQIAVMDIDNFKKVNDTYGHRAGDNVLREVASIARSKVGPNDFVARYGGEEFVILFTELAYPAAFDTVEEIRRTVAETPHDSLGGLAVTVSVGVNRYVPGMGKERFFQGADAALYHAKRTGKNRTVAAETIDSGTAAASAAASVAASIARD
ncbi:GGDEF domain-containing protein [Cohnella sp. CFH 77786]|uniref:GGDEF domain-containing protein n=1 Tax=Cohnella sp. CFH 77786 TaxID=2662265 RepID=UPI001C60A6C5|nr:GGDEF domain-containing protein [Cohnella sp. CFH 77786]